MHFDFQSIEAIYPSWPDEHVVACFLFETLRALLPVDRWKRAKEKFEQESRPPVIQGSPRNLDGPKSEMHRRAFSLSSVVAVAS